MATFNLDIVLHRLREEKKWCNKKLSHFIRLLEDRNLISTQNKKRSVNNIDKVIEEFEKIERNE